MISLALTLIKLIHHSESSASKSKHGVKDHNAFYTFREFFPYIISNTCFKYARNLKLLCEINLEYYTLPLFWFFLVEFSYSILLAHPSRTAI